jgi:hypothetical protein
MVITFSRMCRAGVFNHRDLTRETQRLAKLRNFFANSETEKLAMSSKTDFSCWYGSCMMHMLSPGHGLKAELKGKKMFDQISKPSAPATREASYRSERNARNSRGATADAHAYRTDTDISSRKAVERADRHGIFQVIVGLMFMSAITLGGLEVFLRLCANTAMVR